MSYVFGLMSYVLRLMSNVECLMYFVLCPMSNVLCLMHFVLCFTSYGLFLMSYVLYRVCYVSCLMYCVLCLRCRARPSQEDPARHWTTGEAAWAEEEEEEEVRTATKPKPLGIYPSVSSSSPRGAWRACQVAASSAARPRPPPPPRAGQGVAEARNGCRACSARWGPPRARPTWPTPARSSGCRPTCWRGSAPIAWSPPCPDRAVTTVSAHTFFCIEYRSKVCFLSPLTCLSSLSGR
jgi:hypothetical protein